jgi:predicted nucleic acid-binding protein
LNGQYVLDTSVLVQAAVEDIHSLRVEGLLDQLRGSTPIHLHVPEFSLIECGNVLWKRVRFRGTPLEEAKSALIDLLSLPLDIHAPAALLPRALDIAAEHKLAVYACLHIALAEALNIPFITVDERQARVAASSGVTLKPITDFPEFVEPEETNE